MVRDKSGCQRWTKGNLVNGTLWDDETKRLFDEWLSTNSPFPRRSPILNVFGPPDDLSVIIRGQPFPLTTTKYYNFFDGKAKLTALNLPFPVELQGALHQQHHIRLTDWIHVDMRRFRVEARKHGGVDVANVTCKKIAKKIFHALSVINYIYYLNIISIK